MANIRQRLGRLFVGKEMDDLRTGVRTLENAYLAGKYTITPQMLIERLSEGATDQMIDLITRLTTDYVGLIGYEGDAETMRGYYVNECRNLWRGDVVSQWAVWLWTNFGFGENVEVLPEDKAAQPVWKEFWDSDANMPILGADGLHRLSENVLVEGEFWLVYYIDKTGTNPPTVRTISTDEITEIVTDPEDDATPLYYKREWSNRSGDSDCLYYADWLAVRDPAKLSRADLPSDAKRAETQKSNTMVVAQHVAHNRKVFNGNGKLRGWPMYSAGASWAREHTRFRENRASVTAAIAMYVNKIKATAGSRQIDNIASNLQSALAGGNIETNPASAAGSTWVENQALDLQRLSQQTGASDAKVDGESLMQMASLGAGAYSHYFGSGDSYRLATACYSDDTEVLTENGWKSWRDWESDEKIATYNSGKRRIEYAVPTKLHTYQYEGEMVHITNRAIDALVTPNHRMLAQEAHKPDEEFKVYRADELPRRFLLPTQAYIESRPEIETFLLPGHTYYAGNHHSRRDVPAIEYSMDDWLEFLGWWLADGSIDKSSYKRVQIAQNIDSPYADELDYLLSTKMGFSRTTTQQGTHWLWSRTSKSLYDWLKKNCKKGAANKRIPHFVFGLNRRQTEILVNAMWKGDGHFAKGKKRYIGCYTSISHRLVDDVQILLLHLGDWGRSRLLFAENAHPEHRQGKAVYRIHRTNRCHVHVDDRNGSVQTIQYKGIVWCFEAPPNKMFITRRNGCPLIAGNTAMEPPTQRQWSRYQNFWGAQWRKMVRIVLWAAETYSAEKKLFANHNAQVSTDRLVELGLQEVSDSMSQMLRDGLAPYLEAGVISIDVAVEILTAVWQMTLQALGISDVLEIVPPDEVKPDDDEEAPDVDDDYDMNPVDEPDNGQEPAELATASALVELMKGWDRRMEMVEGTLRENHTAHEVQVKCPLPDCEGELAYRYDGHPDALLVCATCERTFNVELE